MVLSHPIRLGLLWLPESVDDLLQRATVLRSSGENGKVEDEGASKRRRVQKPLPSLSSSLGSSMDSAVDVDETLAEGGDDEEEKDPGSEEKRDEEDDENMYVFQGTDYRKTVSSPCNPSWLSLYRYVVRGKRIGRP